MRKLLTVMILAGALRGPAAAQQGLALIQPDAGFVFGIEWRKIVTSSVGGELSSQIKNQMGQQPEMQKMQDAILHDLDSIVIAAPASGLAKGNAKPPMLFVMSGHFKQDELLRLTKSQLKNSETYRAVELLIPPDDSSKDSRIAFLDGTTILGGDNSEVRAAIDRLKNGHLTAVKGGILDGIADLRSNNALWMTVEIPESALKDANPMAAQMFAGVKGAELGMSFDRGLGLLLNIRTISTDAAATVAQSLQGLIAMGAMSQSDSPDTAELIKKLQVKSEATRVSVGLALNQGDLDKMIEKLKAGAAKSAAPKGAKI
jgi:hypothetical protein